MRHFPRPKVAPLCFYFCPNNNPPPKGIQFTIIEHKKQQVQYIFAIFVLKKT